MSNRSISQATFLRGYKPLIIPVPESEAFNLNINRREQHYAQQLFRHGERRAHELTRSISTFSRRPSPTLYPSYPPNSLSRNGLVLRIIVPNDLGNDEAIRLFIRLLCRFVRLLSVTPLSLFSVVLLRGVFRHCLNTILSFTN